MASIVQNTEQQIELQNPSDRRRYLRMTAGDGILCVEGNGMIWLTAKNTDALLCWLTSQVRILSPNP